MYKNLIVVFFLFVLTGCGKAQTNKSENSLPATEFSKKLDLAKDAQLVDVRTPGEFKNGHLKNAMNVDWNAGDFGEKASVLDKGKPVYFVLYAFFIIGILILFISINQNLSKFISSIAVNISLNTFVPLVLLLLGIISKHQIDACRTQPKNLLETYKCDGILEILGMDLTSFMLLIIGFIFVFFYTKVLRKWKAKTE